MLQRIEPETAELGMFIERLEGNWLTHPFWKRRFVLSDAKQLAALHASSVKGVIIDTSKGAAPTLTPAKARTSPASALHARTERLMSVSVPARSPVASIKTELPGTRQFGNAKRVARQADKVVSQIFLKARLGQSVRLQDVEAVLDDIYHSVSQNPFTLTAILRCQRNTGEAYRHALAVGALMVSLGRAMRLPQAEIKEAGIVGLMMDVGVGQMDSLLESVSGDYRALPQQYLDQHIYYGHDIMVGTQGIAPPCLQACLDHHERLDGSGYPNRLAGDAIGRLARMAAICDEFEYLVSGGFRSPPMDPHEAVMILMGRAPEFDSDILRSFLRSTGLYPIGTFVELRSGRLAMVVDINPDETDLPIVRTFGSWTASRASGQVTVDLGCAYGADGITGVAKPVGLSGVEVDSLRERLLAAAHRA